METDAALPLGAYGLPKLADKLAVGTVNARHVIFRTQWDCGAHPSNFLKTMLQRTDLERRRSVVDDQRGAPTSAFDIAELFGSDTVPGPRRRTVVLNEVVIHTRGGQRLRLHVIEKETHGSRKMAVE